MRSTKPLNKKTKITIQTITSHTFIPSRYYLQRWINKALSEQERKNEINIRLVSKNESATLNTHYRYKKGPTNILSFPFETPPGIYSPLVGDLVICAALVNQEARKQQKVRLAHWAHLVIHGCLHLIGYDHIDSNDAFRMETREIQLLEELGYGNPYL